MRTILAAIGAVVLRILEAIAAWEEKQKKRKRQAEIERLRNETIEWWQDNFGIDGADDSRLPDVTKEAADATKAAADDHSS